MDYIEVSKFRTNEIDEDLDVMLGTYWQSRKGKIGGPGSWQEVNKIFIINDAGIKIPLMSLLERSFGSSIPTIIHKNGVRCATVSAKVFQTTPTDIEEQLKPKLDEISKNWPANCNYELSGEVSSSADTYSSLNKIFFIAMVIVFSILALQFNSFLQPIIILFSVIFAITGVFAGFFWFDITMSFNAVIGIIALIGIVVNDAIIMIDTMNRYVKNGLNVKDAAAKGASDRLRPVFITTITTVLGLIPLAISDNAWMPLCLAIIFGQSFTTLISVFLIPSLFLLLTSEKNELKLTKDQLFF
ncbi:efflux RND transporter permease subunit [Lentisphaerota bacterium WC36G]|nr:efflux RND transporter permease subunit [Lentisphaerae bacterium WC36]